MKTKPFKLTLIALTLMICACSPTSEGDTTTDNLELTREVDRFIETELVLNNGNKWQANPETTKGVTNMISLVNAVNEHGNESYQTLAGDLNAEFSMIFQLCTMKGEAHNQLHNFLFPIKTYIERLNSEDLEAGKHTVSHLKTHLAKYHNYFE